MCSRASVFKSKFIKMSKPDLTVPHGKGRAYMGQASSNKRSNAARGKPEVAQLGRDGQLGRNSKHKHAPMDHPGTELGVSQHGHRGAAPGPMGCSEHEMNPPAVEGAQEEPNRSGGSTRGTKQVWRAQR